MKHGTYVCIGKNLWSTRLELFKKLKEVEDNEDDCFVCEIDEENCMGYLKVFTDNLVSGKNKKQVIKIDKTTTSKYGS